MSWETDETWHNWTPDDLQSAVRLLLDQGFIVVSLDPKRGQITVKVPK